MICWVSFVSLISENYMELNTYEVQSVMFVILVLFYFSGKISLQA